MELGGDLARLVDERLIVLHDRRIPECGSHVDHIVISPGGVFLVNVKYSQGFVETRERAGVFPTHERLHVGGRDRTGLVVAAARKEAAVREILWAAGFEYVPVRPVLCFVAADWRRVPSAIELEDVLITWPDGLIGLVQENTAAETAAIHDVARLLDSALPV